MTGIAHRIAAIAVIAFMTLAAAAADGGRKQLDVPAGDLVAALESLAKQTGVQLIYQSAQLSGIKTKGVSGVHTPKEAVDRLLDGTTLTVRTDPSGAMLIGLPPAGDRASPSRGSASNPSSAVQLESLMVTATKRAERLSDVPQAVAVLPAEDLLRQGATQFRDYADLVPGLSLVTSGAGNTLITLRGVTVGIDISSTTAIYLDEVPYGSSTTFGGSSFTTLDSSLFDVDRVEVLKGPQGTLYGASSMGGLIKYVARRPRSDRFEGEVQAGIASTHGGGVGYTTGAVVNVPLSPGTAAIRASAFSLRDSGYVDNVKLGDEDVNRTEIKGGRLDALLTPTRELSVRLAGFAQNIDRDGHGTVDYTLAGTPVHGELAQSRGAPEPFTQRYRLLSATIEYDLGASRLTSVTADQSIRNVQYTDLTASTGAVLALCPPFCRNYGSVSAFAGLNIDKFSQELRLASQDSRKLEWIVGGFYTRERTALHSEYVLTDPQGRPATNDVLIYDSPSAYKELSGFGDLTWHFTDKLDATVGARVASHEVSTSAVGSGLFGAGATTPARESTDRVATYLVNGRYRPDDWTTAYARYATGYRPGGPNVGFTDPITGAPVGPPSFGSDSLKSYEVGFRRETTDRRFSVDLAAYYIDWKDIQLSLVSGPYAYRDNAPGGARVQGAEVAIAARPTRDLGISAALAYTNAELAAAVPSLGGRDGERLPGVPRLTANFVADYVFSGAGWKPSIGTTIRHVSDRPSSFDASVSPRQYILPDYTTVDFRAGLSLRLLDLQLYVRNATDERAQLSRLFTAAANRVAISQPRTYGLMGTVRF